MNRTKVEWLCLKVPLPARASSPVGASWLSPVYSHFGTSLTQVQLDYFYRKLAIVKRLE
jgi:hypothetical protein